MADLLSAISVLLVFLTFLLTIIEKEISENLSKVKPPPAQVSARKEFIRETKRLFWLKSLPATAIFLITFYVLLPKAIGILSISDFSIWNFNELNTIFIFIETGLLGLTVFLLAKSIQLFKNLRE